MLQVFHMAYQENKWSDSDWKTEQEKEEVIERGGSSC